MKEKEEPLDHMQRITKFSFKRVDIGDCRRGRITEWKRSTAMEKSIYIENCGIENWTAKLMLWNKKLLQTINCPLFYDEENRVALKL